MSAKAIRISRKIIPPLEILSIYTLELLHLSALAWAPWGPSGEGGICDEILAGLVDTSGFPGQAEEMSPVSYEQGP